MISNRAWINIKGRRGNFTFVLAKLFLGYASKLEGICNWLNWFSMFCEIWWNGLWSDPVWNFFFLWWTDCGVTLFSVTILKKSFDQLWLIYENGYRNWKVINIVHSFDLFMFGWFVFCNKCFVSCSWFWSMNLFLCEYWVRWDYEFGSYNHSKRLYNSKFLTKIKNL